LRAHLLKAQKQDALDESKASCSIVFVLVLMSERKGQYQNFIFISNQVFLHILSTVPFYILPEI